MAYLKSYKRLNRLMQNESFEPMISWGLRMALAGTLPVIWGLATGRLADAIWVTLAGESVSWVELKGAFVWRFRTLLVGAALAVGFGILGSVTGTSIWFSVVCMFGVGFLATLLKNIGDRANNFLIDLVHRAMALYKGNNRNALLHYIAKVAAQPENSFWRVITSLCEVLPAGSEDQKQALGLLTNKDSLIRESKQIQGKQIEQTKLFE